MHGIVHVQAQWRKGLSWIDSNITARLERSASPELKPFEEARQRLLTIRWNEQTEIPGAATPSTTFDFVGFLGTHWLTDTHIDMMFRNLSDRAEQVESLDSFIIIEDLRFMADINKATSARDHNEPLTRFLRRLEERIISRSTKSDTLLFPAHLPKHKHWVAIKIDFDAETISYGEHFVVSASLKSLARCQEGDYCVGWEEEKG